MRRGGVATRLVGARKAGTRYRRTALMGFEGVSPVQPRLGAEVTVNVSAPRGGTMMQTVAFRSILVAGGRFELYSHYVFGIQAVAASL